MSLFATKLRACLRGGGGPQVGEVTRLGGVTRLSIHFLILIWSHLNDRWGHPILGDPGAVSRVHKMFVVKVYCKIVSILQ